MEDILYGVIVAVVATLILAMIGAAWKRIRAPRGAVSESDLAAEIAKHDAEARQLQTDLDRYASDHARKVEATLRGTKNSAAARGHLYSGTMRSQLEYAMEATQEQFRNEASAKVRAFRKLAWAEGEGHARRREGPGPTLRLGEEARAAVSSWRERDYPVPDASEGPLRPKDLIGEDEEIAPLLEPGGLSWSAAGSE
jgi:hypothetical protein